MNSPLPKHLQPIVEALCETGCQNVNTIIEKLESGGHLEETEALSEQERQMVLNELRSIMEVYDKNDCALK